MIFQFRKNLILVVRGGTFDPADFVDIGNRIAARAPDVRVFVVDDAVSAGDLPANVWSDPTLTLSFRSKFKFRPKRGVHLYNRPIEKLDQAAMMMRLGVDVPHCEKFVPGKALPRELWADHVILKPEDLKLTSHGNFVQIFRRERLQAMALSSFAPSHPVHKTPMIVQRFIDTGEYPCKYRALTLQGEVLYCQRVTLPAKRPGLDALDEVLEAAAIDTGIGIPEYLPAKDADVLAFAKRIAGVFGGIPLLGIDIIRAHDTGRLYALEVNAGGNVWHFSSPYWEGRRKKYPHVAREMHDQFGAFDVAAKALISATRRLAS